MIAHYPTMVIGYVVALACWLGVARALTRSGVDLWVRRPDPAFERPWMDLGLVLLALSGVLGIGQLWIRELLLPESGAWAILGPPINQLLIFSPMPLLLLVRRQSPTTMWLPLDRVWMRLAIGLALAVFVLVVYGALRMGGVPPLSRMTYVVDPDHIYLLVQVFLEDISIAIVMVRLAAALGRRWRAVMITGALFAAGHIPAMLADGDPLAAFGRLVLDAGVAMAVIGVLQRSADIWWFWPVHYALDMMQFLELPPA